MSLFHCSWRSAYESADSEWFDRDRGIRWEKLAGLRASAAAGHTPTARGNDSLPSVVVPTKSDTVRSQERLIYKTVNSPISVQFGRALPKERKCPAKIHKLPKTKQFGASECSCFPSILRCFAPENPISKSGIREYYRSDASGTDHHQSLAGRG